jgi:hypothetical protein
MNTPRLERSAAMTIGIAATAMPFAGSVEEEAERWLRILRAHGEASLILASIGVTEAPVEGEGDRLVASPPAEEPNGASLAARIPVEAMRSASARSAAAVGTEDVLRAVMQVYGDAFDRALHAHGAERQEVLELLDARAELGQRR